MFRKLYFNQFLTYLYEYIMFKYFYKLACNLNSENRWLRILYWFNKILFYRPVNQNLKSVKSSASEQ